MARFNAFFSVSACLLGIASAFPELPFTTSGSTILNSAGASLKYAGTNWPGHGQVMVPEGLQYQSIETIVSDIKSLGMNVIRLTYAIEMIDQIYDNGGSDIDLQTAFTDGLGDTGSSVLSSVLANNPQFTASTTRLEVSMPKSLVNYPLMYKCNRSLMPSWKNAIARRSISTWTTTCPKENGAVVPRMETPGGETRTSTPTTGCEAYRIWPTM